VVDVTPRFAIGIIHYQAYADLECALSAIKLQTAEPDGVFVVDADADPELLEGVRTAHAEFSFEAIPNRGYAAGANRILRWVDQAQPEVEFVLLMNPDVELDPEFCERLMHSMAIDSLVAIGGGKLLRPGRKILDSAGIRMGRNRRMRDRGSEQLDRGQFDQKEYVFGATGAAMMLRRAALPELAIEGELFDEDFFMYQEDTDLSWRANLLGWKVLYEPAATALHTRGWRKADRSEIAVAIRRHSFKNHYLQLVKNEPTNGLVYRLPVILAWEVLRLGFALLRDRAMLPAYVDAWRGLGRAFHKRRILQQRIRA
jgi:GT2 family glycosyltransferase